MRAKKFWSPKTLMRAKEFWSPKTLMRAKEFWTPKGWWEWRSSDLLIRWWERRSSDLLRRWSERMSSDLLRGWSDEARQPLTDGPSGGQAVKATTPVPRSSEGVSNPSPPPAPPPAPFNRNVGEACPSRKKLIKAAQRSVSRPVCHAPLIPRSETLAASVD